MSKQVLVDYKLSLIEERGVRYVSLPSLLQLLKASEDALRGKRIRGADAVRVIRAGIADAGASAVLS